MGSGTPSLREARIPLKCGYLLKHTPFGCKKQTGASGREADGWLDVQPVMLRDSCSQECSPLPKEFARKGNFLSLRTHPRPKPPVLAYLSPKSDLPRKDSYGVHFQDQKRGEKHERHENLVLHHFGTPEKETVSLRVLPRSI